jgi:hypothetical protein
MRLTTRPILVLALLGVAVACSPARPAGGAAPRQRADRISQEEILRRDWSNVYEVVSTLRPQWLQVRGRDTLGQQGEIRAYLNSARLVSMEALRDMPAMGILYIQFVDPIAASARWGLDHGQGAIVVATHDR